ncbi:MAG: prolyl oligopeptidase family serine peptidase [Halobaculum sp.]
MAGFEIDRLLAVENVQTPSVRPDGGIVFLSDVTGSLQVWEMDGPGRWPTQRTVHDGGVQFVSHSPTRREFLFGSDDEGNGHTQLYLVDDATPRRLTDADAVHRFGGWGPDGDRIAVASNRRRPEAFDVYVTDRRGEERLVYEADGWLDPAGWHPDGDRLVVIGGASNEDVELFEIDVATGRRRHLTPFDDAVRFSSPNWADDAVYLVTDHGADTRYVARLADGTLTPIAGTDDHDVAGVAYHHPSRRLAFGRNVNGVSRVVTGRVAGDRLDRFPEPDLPAGVAGEATFGPDGERLTLTVTTRRHPPDVYRIDVTTGAVTRWTTAATGGIPRDQFHEPEPVRYDADDGLAIPAWLTLPPNPDGPVPAVVDFHGGPERQRRPGFRALTQYLTSRGIAVLEPNVRGSTGYGRRYAALDDGRKRADAVRDAVQAARFLDDHPRVDGDRVAAYGESYGGFLALAAVTHADRFAAAVSVSGIVDLVAFLEDTAGWRRRRREAEYGSLDEHRAFLADLSPANRLDRLDVPVALVHGENDPRVPVDAVREFADDAPVPVETQFLPGEGHGLRRAESRSTAFAAVARFLTDRL